MGECGQAEVTQDWASAYVSVGASWPSAERMLAGRDTAPGSAREKTGAGVPALAALQPVCGTADVAGPLKPGQGAGPHDCAVWDLLPRYAHGSPREGLARSVRPSVRAVVFNADGTLLLTTTDEYHEYVFPGGGVDAGESDLAALARELEEETGWLLVPSSAQPLLSIDDYHNRLDLNLSLCQRNRYFVCRAYAGGSMHLDAFEARTGLRPERVPLYAAIARNEQILAAKRLFWVERDTLVMRLLREHGLG